MNFLLRNIIPVLTICFVLSSCGKKDPESEAASESKGIEVTLTNPVKTRMTEYVNLNAVTIFQNQESVRATFAGFIVKCYKNPGDHIRPGDLLFLMRTKESSAADSISLGSREFSGLVKIYSRTSGIMTELDFQAGNYVSEGDKLAIIVEPQSLKIMLNVPYQYSSLISNSGMYTIQLPDGRSHQARVIKKIPAIDQANQTQTFILEPVPPMEIPANLNLIVRIPVRNADNAIALPKSAVISNETQTEFWTMKAVNDTLAIKLKVKKGIETDSLVQIIQPILNVNDRFI
ncbi:MAG: efflux RND transporter periplasmic adaptor subunit, partial [Bacteroidota bacterium]|nr:efflux RND transporter periplasmic adaptor subunit [Bacteroidota bacterium]